MAGKQYSRQKSTAHMWLSTLGFTDKASEKNDKYIYINRSIIPKWRPALALGLAHILSHDLPLSWNSKMPWDTLLLSSASGSHTCSGLWLNGAKGKALIGLKGRKHGSLVFRLQLGTKWQSRRMSEHCLTKRVSSKGFSLVEALRTPDINSPHCSG